MMVNIADPSAIRMLVRSPAGFRRYSRSNPIAAPSPAASINRRTRPGAGTPYRRTAEGDPERGALHSQEGGVHLQERGGPFTGRCGVQPQEGVGPSAGT